MAFMIHPEHGATNTEDIAGHEAHGWKKSTTEEWLGEKLNKEPTKEIPTETIPEPPKEIREQRRPGRPPRGN